MALKEGKVISFLNMKGGVGKTTLCKEIGYYLYKQENKKVLFIDVDPQANLTQSVFKKYGYRQKGETGTEGRQKLSSASVDVVFNYSSVVEEVNLNDALLQITNGLSIIPGDLNTVFLERTAGGAEKDNSLKNFLDDFKLKQKYDYILLDCPPTYSFYTTAALLASDFYLSPIKPDSYSVLGIDLLHQVVTRLKKIHRDKFRYKPIYNLGVVFSNIANTPSKGTSDLIVEIKESEKLSKYEIYFFSDFFITNPEIPKQIDYFINDYNSEKSILNLSNIVYEMKERMEIICQEKNTSERN